LLPASNENLSQIVSFNGLQNFVLETSVNKFNCYFWDVQKLFAFVLICCLLCQALGSLGIGLVFATKQQAIANQFCINKAKPTMHCNGKCWLKKRLDGNEKQQQSVEKGIGAFVAVLTTAATNFEGLTVSVSEIASGFCYLDAKPIGIHSLPFHPPRA